ncbi:MAG: hypothetical protein CMA70_04855 [Euryarchaeota archaeon]|nr:hypothetical protein [Euryarchaeota archaeon]
MAKKTVEEKDFLSPIRESISNLESEAAEIEVKVADLLVWEAELRSKQKQITLLKRTLGKLNGDPARPMRARGKNLEDILKYLGSKPAQASGGATVREIAEATEINIPSVRYTLGGNPIRFKRGEQNKWTLCEVSAQ